MTEDQIIDEGLLARLLDNVGGDRSFLVELIDTFLKDTPQQLAIIQESLKNGQAEDLRRAAHSLKSNSASFGAVRFSAICKQLEETAKAGDLAAAVGLAEQIRSGYPGVRQALEGIRNSS